MKWNEHNSSRAVIVEEKADLAIVAIPLWSSFMHSLKLMEAYRSNARFLTSTYLSQQVGQTIRLYLIFIALMSARTQHQHTHISRTPQTHIFSSTVMNEYMREEEKIELRFIEQWHANGFMIVLSMPCVVFSFALCYVRESSLSSWMSILQHYITHNTVSRLAIGVFYELFVATIGRWTGRL